MTKKYYLFGILIWKVETEKPKELEVSPEVADFLRAITLYYSSVDELKKQ